MKNTNKKILQTKQALRNALCSLIESENIQDITVSQVCREAKINRTTFYKYYSLPIDILREYLEEICDQNLKRIDNEYDISSENGIYTTMLEICLIYYENKQIMKVFIEFNKYLLSIIQRVISEKMTPAITQNNLTYFIAGGVAAVIFQWSINDYKQSPEDIAKMLTQSILKLNSSSD